MPVQNVRLTDVAGKPPRHESTGMTYDDDADAPRPATGDAVRWAARAADAARSRSARVEEISARSA